MTIVNFRKYGVLVAGVTLSTCCAVASPIEHTPPDSVAQSVNVDNQNQEGRPITVEGLAERVLPESDGKVGVAIGEHAQMFFLYRADPDFETRLATLTDAVKNGRKVTCVVRAYSGRILSVTPK